VSETFAEIAGRRHERKAWRECRRAFAFHQCLQSVIEPNVFETVVTFSERVRNRVGELMGLTENGPLLREDK
jgi:hypothetical protein